MSTARPLLVVEDDHAMQRQLRWSLDGYDILQAYEREEALSFIRSHEPPVVLLDLGLPPEEEDVSEGMAALSAILDLQPRTKVIVLTGREGREHARRAIALGAHDYHGKPIEPADLLLILERAFYLAGLESENERLAEGAEQPRIPGLIGDSPVMLKLTKTIERVAPIDVSVVLRGESGTGKELVARALHALSARRKKRFVAINCAAIPPTLLEAELFGYERGAFTGATQRNIGRIELAQGGTLFLDEIGDLSTDLQAKLLRFLQERVLERLGGREEIAVDVRVICATHRNLEELVSARGFREDLFYRLSEVTLDIPPLRERVGDAVLLTRHFLAAYAKELGRRPSGLSSEAAAAIDAYQWPGNVRELQNRVKRAVIMSEGRRISTADLDLAVDESQSLPLNLRQVRDRAELVTLKKALARSQGNISKAAKLLGVSRPTLYDLLRHHQLRG